MISQSGLLTSQLLRHCVLSIQRCCKAMFKKLFRKIKYFWIPPHLKSRESRIPGFGILFKNSNSGLHYSKQIVNVGEEGRVPPPSHSSIASFVQETWRQPIEGRLLYIWDMMLLNWVRPSTEWAYCIQNCCVDVNLRPSISQILCIYRVIVTHIHYFFEYC